MNKKEKKPLKVVYDSFTYDAIVYCPYCGNKLYGGIT